MKKQKSKNKAASSVSKYMLQMTRKGVFLGICLFFFISAWMFILGVLVGRGTAPVHFDIEVLQNELIALKESIIKQEQDKQRADAALVEKKQELDFYEALKGTKQEEELKLKPQEQKIKPPAAKKAPTKTLAARKNAPTSLKKKTAAEKSSASKGSYTVQVVSTKDSRAADQVVKKLQKKGYRAYKVKAEITGKGTWFRVRVGGFSSRSEADRMYKKLSKEGYKGMVVKN